MAKVAQGHACCSLLQSLSFASALPVFVVQTDANTTIQDEPKVSARLCNYDGAIGIEIRGSTSARDFSKKSYAVETRDAQGQDVDVALLGLEPDDDWILYGPEHDPSLGLRNTLTFALGRHLTVFSPATRFVEVFVAEDGVPLAMQHYKGLYVLTEKIKRGKKRVDIKSSGVIIKHDNNNIDAGDKHFRLDRSSLDMIVVYPKKKDVTPQDMQDIKSYLDAFEASLFEGNSTSYFSFIDLESFVDYFLMTELTKNPDGYRGSTYLHKDRGGVLKMGPLWDYNEAYGLCCGYPIEGYFNEGRSYGRSGGSAISTNGWRFNICSEPRRCLVDPLDGVSQWYRILWTDSTFQDAVRWRWTSLREGPFSDDRIQGIIAAARREIQHAALRNNDRWAEVLGYRDAAPTLSAIARLESWTLSRTAWMDTQLHVAVPQDPMAAGLRGFQTVA